MVCFFQFQHHIPVYDLFLSVSTPYTCIWFVSFSFFQFQHHIPYMICFFQFQHDIPVYDLFLSVSTPYTCILFVSFRKEGSVLFNDALNTFYLWLYGIGHMVKDHSDSERGNPLLPHGLFFPINSKGSFICTIP